MIWSQFKFLVEQAGVKDPDEIAYIDVQLDTGKLSIASLGGFCWSIEDSFENGDATYALARCPVCCHTPISPSLTGCPSGFHYGDLR